MVEVIVSFIVGVALGAFVVRKFFPKVVIDVRTVERFVEVPVSKKKNV